MLNGLDHMDLQQFPTIAELHVLARSNKSGSIDAQYMLGAFYLEGKMGAPKDFELGMFWLHKAAEAGEVNAQCLLGSIYAEGREDVEKDAEQALDWLNKAILQGDATAKLILGCIYTGAKDVVAKDLDQAMYWLEQAHLSQNSEAEAISGAPAITHDFNARRASHDASQQQSSLEETQHDRQRSTLS